MKKKIVKSALLMAVAVAFAVILSHMITFHDKYYMAESVSESKKQIAFTFDDGPGEYTSLLLEGLREREAKASFFLLGCYAEQYPELVAEIHDDGHLIGNHTYSHINMFKSTISEVQEQLEKTDSIIEEITGEKPEFVRPPYGAFTDITLERINKIAVMWSMCPKDWEHEDDADYICNYIVEHAKDGQIVLLHDPRPATVTAVLKAMDILKEAGFEFVRADELLCRGGKQLSAGLGYRYCGNDGIIYWF